MEDKGKVSVPRLIGGSLLFTLVYTVLFFAITNYFHWHFYKEFRYKELLVETSYNTFDWVDNAVATIAMAACVLVIEIVRHIVRSRRTSPQSRVQA